LNLPFTHAESKPSNLILAKNEAAFGHTGLLYLWGQTPGAPAVHKIMPGAAIGYRNIGVHPVSNRYGNNYIRRPRLLRLDGDSGEASLNVRENEAEDYPKLKEMTAVAVDMGENGLMTADEFRILSAPGSMEMISPEEIAEICVQELLGIGTGHNVLAWIRGSVLTPGLFRAGVSRTSAERCFGKLDELDATRKAATMPYVALGRLGPPSLVSKILVEAHILKLQFGFDGLQKLVDCNPLELSRDLSTKVQKAAKQEFCCTGSSVTLPSLIHVAPTIGVPVLLRDNVMLRGPNLTVPEPHGDDSIFDLTTQEAINEHVRGGWVDLTHSNLQVYGRNEPAIFCQSLP
jgi:hypothetical protein